MYAMTVCTIRCNQVACCAELAVLAELVIIGCICMAIGAINLAAILTNRPFRNVDIRVAADAGLIAVHGMLYASFIDMQGNGITIDDFEDIRPGVAGQALLIRESLLVKNTTDFMRLMTVDAARDDVWLFFPQFTFDDFQMHTLNFNVTLGAGVGDICPINRRFRIFVWQDIMRGMATGAHCSYKQATPKQAVTMNGLRVVFERMALRNVTELRDLRSILMAGATKSRNVHGVGFGLRI